MRLGRAPDLAPPWRRVLTTAGRAHATGQQSILAHYI